MYENEKVKHDWITLWERLEEAEAEPRIPVGGGWGRESGSPAPAASEERGMGDAAGCAWQPPDPGDAAVDANGSREAAARGRAGVRISPMPAAPERDPGATPGNPYDVFAGAGAAAGVDGRGSAGTAPLRRRRERRCEQRRRGSVGWMPLALGALTGVLLAGALAVLYHQVGRERALPQFLHWPDRATAARPSQAASAPLRAQAAIVPSPESGQGGPSSLPASSAEETRPDGPRQASPLPAVSPPARPVAGDEVFANAAAVSPEVDAAGTATNEPAAPGELRLAAELPAAEPPPAEPPPPGPAPTVHAAGAGLLRPSSNIVASAGEPQLSPGAPEEADPAVTANAVPEAAAAPQRVALAPEAGSGLERETEALMEQGAQLMTLGDIAAARLFYRRAAEKGSADAAYRLAETFDAARLEQLAVHGLRPDPARALGWYRRAAAAGDARAAARVRALAGAAEAGGG